MAAEEGSRRKTNAKDNGPYEVGQLPNPKKAKSKFYEIARRPWRTEPPLYNTGLYNSGLYAGSQMPRFETSLNLVLAWETYAQESLMDHFLAASAEIFETLFQEVEDEDDGPPEARVWNLACMGVEMNYSTTMAMQDLTRQLIWITSEMTTTRPMVETV